MSSAEFARGLLIFTTARYVRRPERAKMVFAISVIKVVSGGTIDDFTGAFILCGVIIASNSDCLEYRTFRELHASNETRVLASHTNPISRR
jgi:hypothetical protein